MPEIAATPMVQFQTLVIGQILGTPLAKSDALSHNAPVIVRSIGFTLDMTAKPEDAAVVLQTSRRMPVGARVALALVAH